MPGNLPLAPVDFPATLQRQAVRGDCLQARGDILLRRQRCKQRTGQEHESGCAEEESGGNGGGMGRHTDLQSALRAAYSGYAWYSERSVVMP